MLMVVVLPAPFGPRKPKTSPSFTEKEMPSTAVRVLNCFGKILNVDDRHKLIYHEYGASKKIVRKFEKLKYKAS